MSNREGQQYGNYRLMRLLGQGGFAEVYLSEHIYLETFAAVKVLWTRLSDEDTERFRTEARTIARLVHPHIVRVLDFGVEAGTPFLVMDYAPNGTLRQRHPRGLALPLDTVVGYVGQLADALQYAHDQKLIHRDIKPENMLLGRNGEVLLSDFGIALVAQSSRHQSTQDLAGTIAYMAPEQIQSHPRLASDQYSLGIVVYEWLSGERPFSGSFSEIAVKQTIVPPPSLRTKMPGISPDVEQVVTRALEKDPKQRFSSVKDFAAALEQASQSGRQALEQPRLIVPAFYSIPSPAPASVTSLYTPNPTIRNELTTDAQFGVESHPNEPVFSEERVEKNQLWHIDRQQVQAMMLGGILYTIITFCVDLLVHNFSLLTQPFNSALFYYFSPSNILFSLFRVIPLFFGVAFGPWVGLFTGGVGLSLGDYLSGRGFSWYWGLALALIGFIGGLAHQRTRGGSSNLSDLAGADIIGALGIAIGLALPAYGRIWLLNWDLATASTNYLVETIPALIFGLIVLPILLVTYNAVVQRKKSASRSESKD